MLEIFFYVQEGILKAANEMLQEKVTLDRNFITFA